MKELFRVLTLLGFDAVAEKSFPDLLSPTARRASRLRFDAYVESLHLLIEFDGEQHQGKYPWTADKVTAAKAVHDIYLRDQRKNDWVQEGCKYYLLRIPYKRIKHVEEEIRNMVEIIRLHRMYPEDAVPRVYDAFEGERKARLAKAEAEEEA